MRLPVERTFRVALPEKGNFHYAAVPSENVGRALYWRGIRAFEPGTTELFYRLAARCRLVLDIGAYTGVYTLLACASRPDCRVIAFEPMPQAFERLRIQVQLNGWTERCKLWNAAVSREAGTTRLHVPDTALPTSSSLNLEGFRGFDGRLIEVPVTTVDRACADESKVDLVKIDVEGFEDAVLDGMQDTLEKSKPMIVIECNPDGPYSAVDGMLRDQGYHFYHLRETPIPVDRIEPDPDERWRNFLCVSGQVPDLASILFT